MSADMVISNGFAIVYDLADPHAWRQAHAHRCLWGRRFCQHYALDEDHILIMFSPAEDERWQRWEAHRKRWILGTREHAESKAA